MPPISFPIKLWNIVNGCPNELMRWSRDGRQVLINEDRLDDLVDLYPTFLRQPTLYSLHRILASYEFQTDSNGREKTGWVSYSHPYFVRGETHLLELYVLSHQTKRFNARKVKLEADDTKRPKKAARFYPDDMFKRQLAIEIDCKDDLLVPTCSSSLFQFSVNLGLDLDSSCDEQPTLMAGRQRGAKTEEYITSADSSLMIESEPADVDDKLDSDISFCGIQEPLETSGHEVGRWMAEMSESEEWFGLAGQPIAIPVSPDVRIHSVDQTASLSAMYSYTELLQMQVYEDD